MSHPLELSYNWRLPMTFATVAALGCVVLVARGAEPGWVPAALLIVGLWAVLAVVLLRRARAYLMVDGSTLVLRPWREYVRIQGAQVRAVRQILTARGPSYRLTVEQADGTTTKYVAPTAWLRGGHSALFGWLLEQAAEAELDKGSRRTLELLRVRGLIQ